MTSYPVTITVTYTLDIDEAADMEEAEERAYDLFMTWNSDLIEQIAEKTTVAVNGKPMAYEGMSVRND